MVTPLDQALCDELRRLHALRQELTGQCQGLEHELHVARQVDRLLQTQIGALETYLGTCGAAIPALEGPTHG
jgi:hypothetical protein